MNRCIFPYTECTRNKEKRTVPLKRTKHLTLPQLYYGATFCNGLSRNAVNVSLKVRAGFEEATFTLDNKEMLYFLYDYDHELIGNHNCCQLFGDASLLPAKYIEKALS